MMTRRDLLKLGLYGGAAAALPGLLPLSGCGRAQRARNLVLVSIDTLRADHVGCYGYPRPVSPAIDSLASEGVLFEDVTTPSPWTLPAHASLLTGLYPSHHGVKSVTQCLPDRITTVAELLTQSGFHTAAFVNSSLLTRKYGLNQGFSDFKHFHRDAAESEPSRVGNAAEEWLANAGDEPFFLFLHYYDPHSDYVSLTRYEEEFARPYNGIADGTTKQLIEYRAGDVLLDSNDAAHLIDLYDAEIRMVDDSIARVIRSLDHASRLADTVVMITSDHGEEFLDHGGVLHGRTHYREIAGVPLVMRGPGVPKGARVPGVVSLVDVVPTILSLLNLPLPVSVDGINLAPLFTSGVDVPAERVIFSEADHNNSEIDIKRLVRCGSYAYHYDLLEKSAELYDLEEDSAERKNIVSERDSVASRLHAELVEFMTGETSAESGVILSPEEIRRLKSLGYL